METWRVAGPRGGRDWCRALCRLHTKREASHQRAERARPCGVGAGRLSALSLGGLAHAARVLRVDIVRRSEPAPRVTEPRRSRRVTRRWPIGCWPWAASHGLLDMGCWTWGEWQRAPRSQATHAPRCSPRLPWVRAICSPPSAPLAPARISAHARFAPVGGRNPGFASSKAR